MVNNPKCEDSHYYSGEMDQQLRSQLFLQRKWIPISELMISRWKLPIAPDFFWPTWADYSHAYIYLHVPMYTHLKIKYWKGALLLLQKTIVMPPPDVYDKIKTTQN